MAQVWSNSVGRVFDDDDSLPRVGKLECFEVQGRDVPDNKTTLLMITQLKPPDNSLYGGISRAQGRPRILAVPDGATNRQVRAMSLAMVADVTTAEGDAPEPLLMTYYGYRCQEHKSDYSNKCPGCPVPENDDIFELPLNYSGTLEVKIGLQWTAGSYDAAKDTQVIEAPKENTEDEDDGVLTLDSCLRAFAKAETLGEDDMWYCRDCKEHRRAFKKMDLYKLPDLLIIHLKRFIYSSVTREKLTDLVDFPLEGLDMKNYTLDPTQDGRTIYDCYAVSNHMGGMGGGHYNAYVRNMTTNEWWCHDDSSVSKVNDPNQVKSAAAYVLFYKRRGAVTLQ
jgi:hypothetical protein